MDTCCGQGRRRCCASGSGSFVVGALLSHSSPHPHAVAMATNMVASVSLAAVGAATKRGARRTRLDVVSIQRQSSKAPAQPAQDAAVSRRSSLLAAGAVLTSGWVPAVQLPAFAAAEDSQVDFSALKKDILAIIADAKVPGGIGDKGPTLVRSVAPQRGPSSLAVGTRPTDRVLRMTRNKLERTHVS